MWRKTTMTCLSLVVSKLWSIGDSVAVSPLGRIRTSKPENQNVCGTCPTLASAQGWMCSLLSGREKQGICISVCLCKNKTSFNGQIKMALDNKVSKEEAKAGSSLLEQHNELLWLGDCIYIPESVQ